MSEHIVDDRGEVTGEVVRCKDCIHWITIRLADGTEDHRCSGAFAFVRPDADRFCAWGKKL